ncbi:MAG: prolyl oligopeptidase family serine peptidase, partial [Erythrobacter sp.]
MHRISQFRLATLTCAASLAFAPLCGAEAANQTQSERNTSDVSAETAAPTSPPIAEKRDHSYTFHGITISDPYDWLYDKSYPEIDDEDVLEYLRAENAWFEAAMEPHAQLTETLFEEMRARIKEDDSTVPQRRGDYLYWSEFEEGAQYRKHYRKPVGAPDNAEGQLILDETALAEGHEYFRLGAVAVSKNGRYLAYSTDTNGSERYTARVKDLETGELFGDEIPEVRTGLTWVANDTALVYGKANENWRVLDARLHRIGTPVSEDVFLYREEDESFSVNSGLSAQEDYLIIATGDNETSEVRFVSAADPTGELTLVKPRRKGVEYEIDMRDGELFVLTNDEHINFRLAKSPVDSPENWQTVLEGSNEFYLTDFDLFETFMVTEGRLNGLDQVQIRRYDAPTQAEPIAFPEASYTAGLSSNPEYDQTVLRLAYESMVTPDSVYDYHVENGQLELLKQQEIPSGYDGDLYVTQRTEVEARDGTMIPVSVVMRKDREALLRERGIEGPGPLHLYAYGAYGYAVPPGFSTTRLSLLDRGFAYAIAHIRGGDDLGRRWYLQGKLFERANTFNDFVDAGRGLIAQGFTGEGMVTASGGSAGG